MLENKITSAALTLILLASPSAFAEQNPGSQADQTSQPPASAQQESPVPSLPDLQGHPSLQSGTSKVTTQEIFQRLDTDGDGDLTEAELSVYGSPASGKSAAEKDPAIAKELMQTYDTNQDGRVIYQEVEEVHETFEQQRTSQ
ncbi:EF-hand domain-containing protein [Allohahella sp. A8]|uniref:EF-hand domain-containing protein n=1 Tax=Allohahella sp. A8 TaxID=3141461 RepID=UPI003A7FF5F4